MKQITVAILILFTLAPLATAQVRIKELCDVKGQEPLMLRGVGLVVGLSGTGDPDLPATMRA
ncbi:MAG: flagellar basal body P-ring protein FlgI, partial [Planctomycetota bacterium]|nr:flagellar basal body P-ring protein FlgI [Planctomycetota bacterium]